MFNRLIPLAMLLLLSLASCSGPDTVVRPGSHFTKSSSIALVTGADNAIFRPELEKELLRSGFNVVSEAPPQTVAEEKEKKSEETKAAGDAAAVRTKAEYLGKIEYIYKPGSHTVSRVNFSIVESATGSVVVSMSYEDDGKNQETAREIVKGLEKALERSK